MAERWLVFYRTPTQDGFFDVIEADEEELLTELHCGKNFVAVDGFVEDNHGNETKERLIIPIDNIHTFRRPPEDSAEEKKLRLGPSI